MTVLDDLNRYYDAAGIHPLNFHCEHREKCSHNSVDFVEARSAYVGREYEGGSLPRLLFLSLDPGQELGDAQRRSPEGQRAWEEEHCKAETLPRNKHWYRTHELALTFLAQFKNDLTLDDVHLYFAHATSAKCCMNRSGNAKAPSRLFKNCRRYVRGEIILLEPDIIVTQGNDARIAIESSFPPSPSSVIGDMKQCSHAVLDVAGRDGRVRKVLWFHTYHPRNGRFYRQRRECFRDWADLVLRFVHGQPNNGLE
jgi:hypothetical protein